MIRILNNSGDLLLEVDAANLRDANLSAEPKLCLSVDECHMLLHYARDYIETDLMLSVIKFLGIKKPSRYRRK